jgi:hypothetical protein
MHLDLMALSAQESPVPLPKFQMAPRLKILISSGSKKETWIYYPFFFLKSPGKQIPSRFPNGAPRERDTHLQGIFKYLSIYILLSFSHSPRWGRPLHVPQQGPYRQGYSVTRATVQARGFYLFIHSFMYVCQSPQKGALLHIYRKNNRSPSMEPHADRMPTYNGVRPGSPRGSLTTLLSLPQCHAAFGTIPSTLAWVDQSPVSQRVS